MKGNFYEFFDPIHNEIAKVGILPKNYKYFCDGIIPLYEFVKPGYCIFNFKNRIEMGK